MDRIGVISLGKMGLPIARNLMVRGFHVTGYRRSGSLELIKEGGTMAASKEVFDKALADGWGHLDIACVPDQVSGVSALGEDE